MKRFSITICAIFLTLAVHGQVDVSGSGRAMQFDGIDDYVNLGNVYDDLTFPFTVSAWVKTSSDGFSMPILVTQDNAPLYNGFWFVVDRVTFFLEYGDGKGENIPAFRKGKSALYVAGEWGHVCAVVKGIDNISMYYNGQDVGGVKTGSSTLPMASNYPNDECKIGLYNSNGQTFRFKGLMDELRLFNRELSVTEIRQQMCMRLKGNEPGLIGYWDFDETSGNQLLDKSTNHFNGTIFGNPQRVFSGAPVGDKSVFLYPGNWTGASLTMNVGSDNLTVNDIQRNPYGVHIYQVAKDPSQQTGIPSGLTKSPYYGIFLAANDNNNTFDLRYNGSTACQSYNRLDNSIDTWTRESLPVQDRFFRMEVLASVDPPLTVDLGADKVVCDQSSAEIKSGIDPADKTFTWNNGATTPDITVTLAGTYILEVHAGCRTDRDTVKVSFEKTPHQISLGNDELTCAFTPRTITPVADVAGLTFTWSIFSHGPTLDVANFGSYWIIGANGCGVVKDTVHFLQLPPDPHPPVNFGPDRAICNQDPFTLSTGLTTTGKTFSWSTGATTPDILVNLPGIYHVTVTSQCRTDQDTIVISMEQPPHQVTLGDDQEVCTITSTTLTPVSDVNGVSFTWQDGSHKPTFDVKNFGTYWVRIENTCGVASDTVHITRLILKSAPPNVITPNGDGKNDVFMLETEVIGKVNIEIFNRWGTSVYSKKNYQNTWGGQGLSPGVYFYRITSECFEEIRGSVSVLHH